MELLPRIFPGVKFIASNENLGFAKANNLALRQAAGSVILFLNPDTVIPEDVLSRTLALLEANGQTGALGIRMIDGSGRFLPESKRGFPSPQASLFKLTGLAGNSACFSADWRPSRPAQCSSRWASNVL